MNSHSFPSRPVRPGTFFIVDRSGLATLIRAAVQDRFGGNLSKAVKATNKRLKYLIDSKPGMRGLGMKPLSQPELWRLAKKQIRCIRDSTLMWLLLLIPSTDFEDLEDTVLSPDARSRLLEYQDFVARHVWLGGSDFIKERNWLIAKWRRQFASEFGSFDRIINARGHSSEAVELAYDRMAGPFVAGSKGGNIERDWNELGMEDQRAYLRAAVRREILLLGRPNDEARAQTEHPSTELVEALWRNQPGPHRTVSYLFS